MSSQLQPHKPTRVKLLAILLVTLFTTAACGTDDGAGVTNLDGTDTGSDGSSSSGSDGSSSSGSEGE